MRSQCFKNVGLAMIFTVFTFSTVNADKHRSDGDKSMATVEAVWQDHEESFLYSSFNTYYSCSGLENSVERLLEELGAKDVKARAIGCAPSRVDRNIRVRVKFKSLSSEAGLKGEKVAAQLQTVELEKIYRRRNLRNGESRCDLVRSVSKSMSDNFELETLQKQSICNSGYSSGSDVKWKVKVLMPTS